MQPPVKPGFLAGVIEGFYGQPWTQPERFELFERMSGWGLNTYLYAPKDDLKHRALWRECYSADEAASLRELILACAKRGIQFFYALSPGLDIGYTSSSDLARLQDRFQQMLDSGCEHFALLFDDIPGELAQEDLQRWGSLAAAQCHLANRLFAWTRQRTSGGRFLFCPTAYCWRMAERNHGGVDYLRIVGRELLPEIDVFWTGPEIISREITVAHANEIGSILRRKPLIWDNLHANDYDGRRFFCGPYSGRPPDLRNAVSGLLCNLNTEFPVNYVPLRTMAEFMRCQHTWDPRTAYLSAMREWLAKVDFAGGTVSFDDLVFFFDCYYLPQEDGAEAEKLFQCARRLLAVPPPQWNDEAHEFRQLAERLLQVCARLPQLRNRPLFHALSRQLWELREELELLDRYVQFKSQTRNTGISFSSDFHLPGTYRGGFVARLQRLLVQAPDGSFTPVAPTHSQQTIC
jgi:protein O-GlcNAcase / histone acetyltransferase